MKLNEVLSMINESSVQQISRTLGRIKDELENPDNLNANFINNKINFLNNFTGDDLNITKKYSSEHTSGVKTNLNSLRRVLVRKQQELRKIPVKSELGNDAYEVLNQQLDDIDKKVEGLRKEQEVDTSSQEISPEKKLFNKRPSPTSA
jgi:hypothetical protein